MKIVVLDGHTLNPGDLSWNGLQQLGDVMVYDRTATVLMTSLKILVMPILFSLTKPP